MEIGFIGFGGAAFGLARGLKSEGVQTFYFYDRMSRTPPFEEVIRKRVEETKAVECSSIEDLLGSADFVFSCVTGAAAFGVAEEAFHFLSERHLFVDVNTCSPEEKRRVGEVVVRSGAAFVDAAMMGGIPTYFHRVPIFASGSGAEKFKQLMDPFGMQISVVPGEPGTAAGIKMLRSIVTKGLLALLIEMLQAADLMGVTDTVLKSIADTLDRKPFVETARLIVTKGVANAGRMTHEMEDVMETLGQLDTPSIMTKATRKTLSGCMNKNPEKAFGGDIPDRLDDVIGFLHARPGN